MKYSVVVPVFNSENSLGELCTRIICVFDQVLNEDYEIILVNDSSKDRSWEIMKSLHKGNEKIKIINLAKNVGQHAATLCGLSNISGDYALLLDDDLQHPPEEIPKLINHILLCNELDVVIGAYIKKKHSLFRNLGSIAMKQTSSLIFRKDTDIKFTSFRIIRGDLAREIAKIHIHKPRIGVLLRHTTSRFSTVMVEHDERKYGSSGYTYLRLCKDYLLNIINNSTLPLKVISLFGILMFVISMFFGIFLVAQHFWGSSSVKGWTSMMVVTTFFSGFILFTLGIIGEYLLRILIETRKMPNYIERDKYM